jgi:hypothetical protein
MSESSRDERRSPLGSEFLDAFRPPEEAATFDELAVVATQHSYGMADVVRWLGSALGGEVIAADEDSPVGHRCYRLTERGRAILADDPRREREAAMQAVG